VLRAWRGVGGNLLVVGRIAVARRYRLLRWRGLAAAVQRHGGFVPTPRTAAGVPAALFRDAARYCVCFAGVARRCVAAARTGGCTQRHCAAAWWFATSTADDGMAGVWFGQQRMTPAATGDGGGRRRAEQDCTVANRA